MKGRTFVDGRAIYMFGGENVREFLVQRARLAGLLPPYRTWTDVSVDGYYIEGELNPCFNEDTEWP